MTLDERFTVDSLDAIDSLGYVDPILERIAKALEALVEKRGGLGYPPDTKDYTRNDALSFAIEHYKGSIKDDSSVVNTATKFYKFLKGE